MPRVRIAAEREAERQNVSHVVLLEGGDQRRRLAAERPV
jgi:hypothetical protein